MTNRPATASTQESDALTTTKLQPVIWVILNIFFTIYVIHIQQFRLRICITTLHISHSVVHITMFTQIQKNTGILNENKVLQYEEISLADSKEVSNHNIWSIHRLSSFEKGLK